jgi:hypothetical protein
MQQNPRGRRGALTPHSQDSRGEGTVLPSRKRVKSPKSGREFTMKRKNLHVEIEEASFQRQTLPYPPRGKKDLGARRCNRIFERNEDERIFLDLLNDL